MYYTYVLESFKDGNNYTGYTIDLQKRFKDHQEGEVLAKKHRRPLELIYYEACKNQQDATRREKYLRDRLKEYNLSRGEL